MVYIWCTLNFIDMILVWSNIRIYDFYDYDYVALWIVLCYTLRLFTSIISIALSLRFNNLLWVNLSIYLRGALEYVPNLGMDDHCRHLVTSGVRTHAVVYTMASLPAKDAARRPQNSPFHTTTARIRPCPHSLKYVRRRVGVRRQIKSSDFMLSHMEESVPLGQ